MRLKVDNIIFLILLVAVLLDGIVAEGIVCLCFLVIYILDKKKNTLIIGKQLFHKSLLFFLFYLSLFAIHIYIGDCGDLIRFYGLTKCICTPALVLLVFPNLCRHKAPFNCTILMVIIFSMIYAMSGLKDGVVLEEISYQFGSFNGCSGIAVILFPIVVFYGRYLIERSYIERGVYYIYILSTFFVVYVSNSLTTGVILFLQLFVLLFTIKRYKLFMIRNAKKICLFVVLMLALITILIGNKTIELDPMALRTRVAIWTRAYNAFSSQDIVSMIIGGCDCWVQMESKVLQAHNVFLEILLIYGIVGLLFFVVSCLYFLKIIFKNKNSYKSVYLILSIVSYFLFCFLHPFYTGVFVFQIICVFGILFLVINDRKNKIVEKN